jgi:hypothetical protein
MVGCARPGVRTRTAFRKRRSTARPAPAPRAREKTFSHYLLDTSPVERSIRKNALFAGSDCGAEHCAVIASLIKTCKLNDVDPLA